MNMRMRLWVAALAVAAAPVLAQAATTRRFEVNDFKEWSKGAAEGVEINSAGGIAPLWSAESSEVPAEGIWTMDGGAGAVYLGTGNSGKLFRWQGGEVSEVADTDHVAITRVRVDKMGRVWFAAVPKGTIYRLSASGKVSKIVQTGEQYVWDFLIDGGQIVAATGPKGKIIRYSLTGDVIAAIETGEKHVMTLAKADDGKVYAGTSGEGLVLELTATSFRVVHDFAESEVRRLVFTGKGEAERLLAAVNDAAGIRPPDVSSSRGISPGDGEEKPGKDGKEGKEGEDEEGGDAPIPPSSSAPRGGGRVSGAVYVLTPTGGARQLVSLDKRAAVDMIAAGDDIYIATDQEGKVYRCTKDGADYALAFDLKQAQALSLYGDGRELALIGTGSPGAAVKVSRQPPAKASYQSDVFDAGFPARFGALDWESDGPVMIYTRSGNVKDTKRGWSPWLPIGLGKPGQARSPEARYIQIKIEWPAASKARVSSLSLAYRVYNQGPFIDAVMVEDADQDGGSGKDAKGKTKDGSGPGPHKTERKAAWKVTNPDEDNLKFQLFFQADDSKPWVPIKTPEPITKPRFVWDTAYVPDGWYRLRVVAMDTPDNAPEDSLSAEAVSEPFLVDNLAPEIKGLSVTGGRVSGRAEDCLSPISGIQFQIDGGEWITVSSTDDVLDSRAENFRFQIPASLEPGPHIIAVRAWDRANNTTAAKEQFLKK